MAVRQVEGGIYRVHYGDRSNLSLLRLAPTPPGNFVKIDIQRLPVRIELTDYDPDKAPLFVGRALETPIVFPEPAEGPDAGKVLQQR